MRAPEVVHVAIKRPQGVDIMAFVTVEYNNDETIRWTRAASAENIQTEVDKVSVYPSIAGEIQSWRPIDPKDIPEQPRDNTGSRLFRAALRDTGEKLEFDLEHSKIIGLNYLRELRNPMFDALDKRWMHALGEGDQATANAIEAQRKALRNLPVEVDFTSVKNVNEIHQQVISKVGEIEESSRLVLAVPITER